MIDAEFAAAVARTALRNVATEYPYKLDQVLGSDDALIAPRVLHPVFHGSYDWHSCVHMHWTLARLLRIHTHHPNAEATRRHFEQRLTAVNEDRAATSWFAVLAPLAQTIADRFVDFLPRATYPTRAGTHGNSAFALLLALDYCETVQHRSLHRLIAERANHWFGRDRRYAAEYEPSGDDFLSSGLVEAALMRRVIDGCSFTDWWGRFQPAHDVISSWLQPAQISDASDPKIVLLHGLNLSRAWCWRQLLPELDHRFKGPVEESIERHLAVSVPAATHGDYVGTHWLASFALLALTEQ